MTLRLEDMIAMSNRMFSQQSTFASLCQTIAEHFYPERADFTVTRHTGDEMADHLMDSYPLLVRRDLCDSFSSMLRNGQDWAEIVVEDESASAKHESKMWLSWASKQMMNLRYDHNSGFSKATKQGDQDFGTFGQTVISVEPNRNYNGILYRNWHLRDCAWEENLAGMVDHVHRKWKPTVFQLLQTFGEDKLHPSFKKRRETDPMSLAEIRHVVMPSDMYGDPRWEKKKYVSCFIDMQHERIIECVGIDHKYYIVPRFQTIAGKPYAFSPAAIAGLPNARTLQAMTFTLMEAAERAARPPYVAQAEVTRSDVDLGPDGITWVDRDYDERFGDAIRPLITDKGGFPIGQDMRGSVVDILNACFYIDRLQLPETNHEMTATEVRERMRQYRQRNLPLFAPMEHEYNGALCEADFMLALEMELIPKATIPKSLSSADTKWQFKGPLSELDDEERVVQFKQASELLSLAAPADPNVVHEVDLRGAVRDAIEATGAPVKWLRETKEVMRLDDIAAKMGAMQLQAANAA